MTTTTIRYDSRGSRGIVAQLSHAAGVVFHTLALWQERHAQRRALAELAREHLQDIGVSEADAAAEVRKPFWRA